MQRSTVREPYRAGRVQARALFNPDRLPAFHDPFAGGAADLSVDTIRANGASLKWRG